MKLCKDCEWLIKDPRAKYMTSLWRCGLVSKTVDPLNGVEIRVIADYCDYQRTSVLSVNCGRAGRHWKEKSVNSTPTSWWQLFLRFLRP